ncbi:MAG: DUF3604 domain-containing protein [Anaerolineae bacterium]
MRAYDGLSAYFGDLHNHCGISYGHGGLEDALRNAREQLDFCSVTGHALWPDMPTPDENIQYIVDFHKEGFARLRERWDSVQRITSAYDLEGEFITFLSFEMHSGADGDRTVLYKGTRGEILEVDSLAELHARLRALWGSGVDVIAFPHHIGYKRGQRGINWATFDPEFAPVVEIISMHGCSEADEVPRPFLHSMGPSDHESTMAYGLAQGYHFGVIGSTDHHSAHPGSYGHGRTGLWAEARTREAIWAALNARRTYALTGDRIRPTFTVDGWPMGALIEPGDLGSLARERGRDIAYHVVGGAPIDCVDVIKNGQLLHRLSRCDVARESQGRPVHTKLHLEVGWGHRGKWVKWDVRFGISDGRLIEVEPRFRGPEIVAPQEADPAMVEHYLSHWEPEGDRAVRFETVTFGNPNNRTPAMQGMCLEVEMLPDAEVWAELNGHCEVLSLRRLLEGARAGRLGKIDAPSYRFHRAPEWWELDWQGGFVDTEPGPSDVYYLRVRQMNNQWAWTSPIRFQS